MKKLFRASALALAVMLSGCAGTDFVRPDPSRVTIAKTTQAEVLKEYGAPFRQGQGLKNEQTVATLAYAYADVGGTPHRPGVTPARAQTFHFHNGILVGHDFVSSWASDNSDFDDSKVSQIVKGKTTRADVERLLGRPAGIHVYPMIKARNGDALVYSYVEGRRAGFASMNFMRKHLVVTINAAGIVEDVEYSTSSN